MGMPSPFDYMKYAESIAIANPQMTPGHMQDLSAHAVAALPVGALPTGLVRPGYANGLDVSPYAQLPPSQPGHNGYGNGMDTSYAPPATPAQGQWNTHAQEEDVKLESDTATTLILRNLPATFDQGTAQEWLDERGYTGQYDFFLWFPAKSTSRLNSCGYAFVNFHTPEDAQVCAKKLHLLRFPNHDDDSESLPLSVAVAKVQGFADNFARFQHLREAATPTRCSPFFAQEAIDALSQAELNAAVENAAANPPPSYPEISGAVTTIVIRNLPAMIESTEIARQWLDAEGFGRQYDFFLYLPAKRQRRIPGKNGPASLQGYGYAFVNFKKAEEAETCVEKLNGKIFGDGTPPLNMVTAKVQGSEQCVAHFSSLTDSGRCTPWVESANTAPGPPPAPRTVFQ